MPTLYLAAPLFSESELAFNAALTAEIERLGSLFLPQRDGVATRAARFLSRGERATHLTERAT